MSHNGVLKVTVWGFTELISAGWSVCHLLVFYSLSLVSFYATFPSNLLCSYCAVSTMKLGGGCTAAYATKHVQSCGAALLIWQKRSGVSPGCWTLLEGRGFSPPYLLEDHRVFSLETVLLWHFGGLVSCWGSVVGKKTFMSLRVRRKQRLMERAKRPGKQRKLIDKNESTNNQRTLQTFLWH